jgi:hypothetical protein
VVSAGLANTEIARRRVLGLKLFPTTATSWCDAPHQNGKAAWNALGDFLIQNLLVNLDHSRAGDEKIGAF